MNKVFKFFIKHKAYFCILSLLLVFGTFQNCGKKEAAYNYASYGPSPTPERLSFNWVGPTSIIKGQCIGYQLELHDRFGNLAFTPSAINVYVSSSYGDFYSDANCAIGTSFASFNANTSSRFLYFVADRVGNGSLSADLYGYYSDYYSITVLNSGSSPTPTPTPSPSPTATPNPNVTVTLRYNTYYTGMGNLACLSPTLRTCNASSTMLLSKLNQIKTSYYPACALSSLGLNTYLLDCTGTQTCNVSYVSTYVWCGSYYSTSAPSPTCTFIHGVNPTLEYGCDSSWTP